jgi:hypothetical protein
MWREGMNIDDYLYKLIKFINNSNLNDFVKETMVKYLRVSHIADLSSIIIENEYADINVDGNRGILITNKADLIKNVGHDLGNCFEYTHFNKVLKTVCNYTASTPLVKQVFEFLETSEKIKKINQLKLAAKLFISKNISISNGELQLNDRTGKLLEIITGRMLLNDNKTMFHHSFDDLIASYSNQVDNWKENKIKVNDSVFVALSWGFHYSEAIPVKHRVKVIAVLTAAINKAVTNATDFDITQLKKFCEDNVPEGVELEKGEYIHCRTFHEIIQEAKDGLKRRRSEETSNTKPNKINEKGNQQTSKQPK